MVCCVRCIRMLAISGLVALLAAQPDVGRRDAWCSGEDHLGSSLER